VCPIACSNFIKLCTGEMGKLGDTKLHYLNCPIHRLVPGGWLQCGDIVDGTCIYI
jgi:cyclophilin family peptidyl-prolyl cis-trans isomerase